MADDDDWDDFLSALGTSSPAQPAATSPEPGNAEATGGLLPELSDGTQYGTPSGDPFVPDGSSSPEEDRAALTVEADESPGLALPEAAATAPMGSEEEQSAGEVQTRLDMSAESSSDIDVDTIMQAIEQAQCMAVQPEGTTVVAAEAAPVDSTGVHCHARQAPPEPVIAESSSTEQSPSFVASTDAAQSTADELPAEARAVPALLSDSPASEIASTAAREGFSSAVNGAEEAEAPALLSEFLADVARSSATASVEGSDTAEETSLPLLDAKPAPVEMSGGVASLGVATQDATDGDATETVASANADGAKTTATLAEEARAGEQGPLSASLPASESPAQLEGTTAVSAGNDATPLLSLDSGQELGGAEALASSKREGGKSVLGVAEELSSVPSLGGRQPVDEGSVFIPPAESNPASSTPLDTSAPAPALPDVADPSIEGQVPVAEAGTFGLEKLTGLVPEECLQLDRAAFDGASVCASLPCSAPCVRGVCACACKRLCVHVWLSAVR